MIGADILGERARLTPDRPALVVMPPAPGSGASPVEAAEEREPLRLSYGELDGRSVRCARLWTERLGLAAGERVGILAHNRVELVEAFFAAGKSGVVLVPLGTRLTAAELAPLVADSGLKALLYDGDLAETVTALRRRLAEDGVTVDHWVALDQPLDSGDLSYGAETSALEEDAAWRPAQVDEEAVYCLLYTSGTTGRPKGVMIPHRMVLANGYQTICGWQLRADDVSPIFTPLYHAGGLMAFLVPIFVIGGSVVLHRAFDAGEVWRTVEAEGCTVILGVPTIWKMLLEAPEFESVDLSRLRWLISGGAPLPHYLIDAYQARGVVFKQGFGMTEVGVNCFAMSLDDSVRKAGSIGRPMMHTEVRLVGEDGSEVAPGEVGELHFRGRHVCAGYWNQPEATAAVLDADGWFHSGDLARRDDEGFFYIAGRAKDMVISGGVNIYPAEIEAALLLHPEVEDVAVVGVPHPEWGEVGVAFVVLREGAAPSTEDLMDHLGERLARYKVPKTYRFVEVLPRTPYGKVVKGELRERFQAEER